MRMPLSTTLPAGRSSVANAAARSISTGARILANNSSQLHGLCTELQPRAHAIALGILSRGRERLWIVIECVGEARPEFQRRNRQQPRAAAVINHCIRRPAAR